MPIKTKIGIALVAVIAVFSVYELSKYVHALAMGGPTLGNISSAIQDTQNCPTCDPNHDGLTNAEDILWGIDPLGPNKNSQGYIYGEEVAAGRNPITGELLNTGNLTDQLSQLTVDGLAAGALNPASASYQQNLADITSSVADSGKYLFNKTVDSDSLTTVLGNTNSSTEYVKQMIPLIKGFSDSFGGQIQNTYKYLNTIGNNGFNSQTKSYFSQQAGAYENIDQNTMALSVPKPFANSAAEFVSLTQQLRDISQAIANGDTDSVKAMLAYQAFGDMLDKYNNFINDFTDTIQNEHIDMDSLKSMLK